MTISFQPGWKWCIYRRRYWFPVFYFLQSIIIIDESWTDLVSFSGFFDGQL